MKKILVVGAGSGIGWALFSSLNKLTGFQVYGISRRGIAFQLEQQIVAGTNYRCDLTKEDEIDLFVSFFKKAHSEIDAIYLCQGDGLFGEFTTIKKESLENHFALNLTSSFLLLQKFYSILRSSKESPFVCFLSSTAGKIGFPESTAYCASKHAVAGFAKSLREEWKKDKIRVFTVFPGAISTEIWEGRPEFDRNDMIDPKDFAEYLKSFLQLPSSINIEDSYILPMKGIL